MFLNTSNISFYYSEKRILNNISFSLEKGKTIAVVGASGSGKSTLLRLLSSIIKKKDISAGEISIKGMTPEEYRKTGELSFMFQDATLMPNLNVRKNIEFPLKLLKRKIIKEEVDELIELVGLREFQKFLPDALSGGMKTRVALARAFITSPELLLLDEPFSALDVSWKFNLYGYLEEIHRKHNTTIVMVTHDIQEAILLADKVFVLSKKGIKTKEKEIIREKQLVFENASVNKYLEKMQNVYLELQSDILIDGINIKNK